MAEEMVHPGSQIPAGSSDARASELQTPTHIDVEAGVRYWEDASVDGAQDEDGALIPGRHGDLWKVRINLAEGRVADWPPVAADVHYKVCDAGRYYLSNDAGERIAKWRGYYVPGDFLCHGDEGYGDYIIMRIGADGQIADYQRPTIDPDEWSLLPGRPKAAPVAGGGAA